MANPFGQYCDGRNNEGTIRQLRLGLSAELVYDALNDVEVDIVGPASFLYGKDFIATFTSENASFKSYKIIDQNDEHGRKPDVGLVVRLNDDIEPSNFKSWWRSVKRRHLVAETTNFNGAVRLITPMEISYEYVQPDGFGLNAYYEFTLKPTKLIDYEQANVVIDAILSASPACETLNLIASVSCLQ